MLWTVLVLIAMQPPQTATPVPSGLILGRVVDGTSGRPIPGAIVTLEGTTAASSTLPRAITNSNGQFVFRRLGRGSFFLNATRSGYVEGAYGRTRPGGTTLSVQLDEGQRVNDVVIRMWKHASISGTVTDEAGEPLVGVQLRAFERRSLIGRPRIVQAGTATTDDRGIYRFGTLAPGEFLIAFVAREVTIPASSAEMLRSPADRTDPAFAELNRSRMMLGVQLMPMPGMANSLVVGDVIRQIDINAPVPPRTEAPGTFIYPTQFFPGVPNAARAAALVLDSGQQRDNVDFTLHPARVVRVSGMIVGADAPVANLALRMVPTSDEALTDIETAATMAGPAGEFTFLAVPAGQYSLRALRVPQRALPPRTPGATTQIQVGSSVMISNAGPGIDGPLPIPDDPTWYADVPIAVANSDLSDVIVTLQRGARLSGRVEFDGTRERPDAAALRRIPIVAERADGSSVGRSGLGFGTSIPPGQIDASGTFKTYGLPPGKYLLRVLGSPAGWTLKSAIADGVDISDTPIDLKATDSANVVITFADRPTTLNGTVHDAEGNPDRDARVIVFPADPAAWIDYGLNPRRMRGTRPARNGSYSFIGLPAGEYYVAAVKDGAFPPWPDPSVLEELSRSASTVHLSDGETQSQDLKTLGAKQ